MNKTAIKNFAVWARNKLIADISYKAGLMGIAEDGIKSALPQSTKDTEFFDIGTKEPCSISGEAVKQRKRLAELIMQKAAASDYKTAYRSVIEEVAYTWFNRLSAIRFMEVNGYLPSRIRALSSEGSTKLEPDLVTTPFDAELDLTAAETELVVKLKQDNEVDECFRLLFVKQCNALNAILPNLFEKTSDYTELLLNVSVTDQDGVVYHLVHDIDEDDFNIEKGGQIEIIGWLYQYYNTEPKDEVFALLKKNVKITKERISAATQLFTPDWIVRYMVENSLGRLWLEGHPNAELQSEWKYYLEEAEQESDVQAQLEKIREEYKTIKPEDIKVIDPCQGSGHILVYAFDALIQIYEAAGYSQRDAAKSILENNIYGLDIDDRAFQLAYFAVMMKARQYNRRILNGEATCHVYSIQESNTVNRDQLKYYGADLNELECNDAMNQITRLLDTFVDAKEYGSILNVDSCNWDLLRRFVAKTKDEGQISIETIGIEDTKEQLMKLIDIGQAMAQKYHVVVTNPPYMTSGSMGNKLQSLILEDYENSKSDTYAVFIEKCKRYLLKQGYCSMITQHSWMFLTTFEKMRSDFLCNRLINMIHLGSRAFEEISGEVVQTVAFCFSKVNLELYKSQFCRLVDLSSSTLKERAFLRHENFYVKRTEQFVKISGKPIIYWASDRLLELFNGKLLSDKFDVKSGLSTGDNDIFVRYWFEISKEYFSVFGKKKFGWIPYNKGGGVRKWYGLNTNVVNWGENGNKIRNYGKAVFRNPTYYFREGITWSGIASTGGTFRYCPEGYLFDSNKGPMIFDRGLNVKVAMALLNTKASQNMLTMLNPTLSLQIGDISSIPFADISEKELELILQITEENINESKSEWDSFESSWNFSQHPLISVIAQNRILFDGMRNIDLLECYSIWERTCTERFNILKANEEKLNSIFTDIYGLQDELTSVVDDKNITIRKADLQRDIKSLLSYAVGCMLGRYSLDCEGLVYAGGDWNINNYSTFVPDTDNIIPITDEEYFGDDIVGLFCGWMKKVYGAASLETNLDFIANALGNKGNTSREIIRNYFLSDFIKDHMKIYQKRPIYWLFDSGKQNGFKALVYMHRYGQNTIGNLRIDYLHRMEYVYESEINRMQDVIDNSTTAREVTAATKRKEKLQKQVKECKEYDEKIAHLALARIGIDLDDGVKVNYEKVQTVDGKKYEVLAKI